MELHPGAIHTYIVSGTEGPADLLEVLLLMKECSLCASRRPRTPSCGSCRCWRPARRSRPRPETMAALMEIAGLPRLRWRSDRRRAGGDDRLFGFEQGRRLPRVGVGRPTPAQVGIWPRSSARARRRLAVLPRPRWRGRSRRRADQRARSGRCRAGTVRRAAEDDRAGRGADGEVRGAGRSPTGSWSWRRAATLATRPAPTRHSRKRPAIDELMDEMARRIGGQVYRSIVVGDPDFVRFFEAVTPVGEISLLRLGSRPAKRSAGGRHRRSASDPVGVLVDAVTDRAAGAGSGWGRRCAAPANGTGWRFYASCGIPVAVLRKRDVVECGDGLRQGRPRRSRGATSRCWDDAEPLASGSGGALEAELELTIAELVDDRWRRAGCSTQSPCCRRRSIAAQPGRRSTVVRSGGAARDGCGRRRRGSVLKQLHRVSQLTINGIASGLRNTG